MKDLAAIAPRVRVLIVDDHDVVRIGLRTILEGRPEIEIVGEAADGAQALASVVAVRPHVVLLDVRLPDIDGLEICRTIKGDPPSPAVLILTSYADDRTVMAAIECGADGYLLKRANGHEIPEQILTVARGGSVLDSLVTRRVLEALKPAARPERTGHDRFALLAPQERKILARVAEGKSNKQIASDLNLSEGTVRNYLTGVFSKLSVQSRVEAAALWLRNEPGEVGR